MASIFFGSSGAVIGNALTGKRPLNGMYLFYTDDDDTDISLISGAIINGDDINDVAAKCISSGIGVTRLTNIATMPGNSGGVLFIANTANQAPISGGAMIGDDQYARAISLANISVEVKNADTGFDYTVLAEPVAVPGGGTITLIDEVTL